MHKLVIQIRRPGDLEAMERRWSEEFVPLAEKMPGLRRVVVGRTVGAPGAAPDVQLVHEFLFDDLESLERAMTSPEGQAAGRALMRLAPREAELFFSEHLEMDLPRPPASDPAEGAA